MEEQLIVDRARLRELLHTKPDWTQEAYATELKRSGDWVRKWSKRLCEAEASDEKVLQSHSRARHTPPEKTAQAVIERILAIRDEPPEGLQRTPGPKAILYYLGKSEALKAAGYRIPRSPTTIWKILDQQGRIVRGAKVEHQPMERAAPMTSWQMDFKENTTVPSVVDGQLQHPVETLNILDVGTSILVDNPVRNDFNAETVITTLAEVFEKHGKPKTLTFDRDTRFVNSWTGRDYPSALLRFLTCLGIVPNVCPAHRPEKNGFVERYNKTYEYECLQIHRPQSQTAVAELNPQFREHYNQERPNQAITCHNQPPRLAFPNLPELPRLPDYVDPDGWLHAIDGKHYIRRVDPSGAVKVDKHVYYIGRAYQKQYVVISVEATKQELVVKQNNITLKRLPIKGLHGGILSFADYLQLISREAVSEWRLAQRQRRRYEAI